MFYLGTFANLVRDEYVNQEYSGDGISRLLPFYMIPFGIGGILIAFIGRGIYSNYGKYSGLLFITFLGITTYVTTTYITSVTFYHNFIETIEFAVDSD